MHEKARKWDEERGYDNTWPDATHQWDQDTPPTNRPCDWCGEPVAHGFIHEGCVEKEVDHWLSTKGA